MRTVGFIIIMDIILSYTTQAIRSNSNKAVAISIVVVVLSSQIGIQISIIVEERTEQDKVESCVQIYGVRKGPCVGYDNVSVVIRFLVVG